MTTVHIFGNPDLPVDALPVQLLPLLVAARPDMTFRLTDPNELDLPAVGEDFTAIDTVEGLATVREIGLDEIAADAARATTHDYDLAAHLLLARKLRPGLRVRIIGVPMGCDTATALAGVLALL